MERIARLEHLARAGYVARAIVYFMLGYLTLATAQTEGTTTVLDDIHNLPAGTVVLVATGIGLIGYGIFRAYGAILDIEGNGTDFEGIGKRIGHIASGIAHLILAYLAIRLAFGHSSAASGNGGNQAASTVMSFTGGQIVLGLVGIGFALAAFDQAVRAVTAKFMSLLEARTPHWAEIVGRIGFAARAVVFAVLAWKIIGAAWKRHADQIGFQAALEALRDISWLYYSVAAGLLVFGIFSLVMARYRAIRDHHVIDRLLR
ncbi:DUF1206 domain-containing protein [Stakelama marina]|uniref:DUF1206 domain-containing protein n=1 Tax=Stakelama marina TaxID=2826939 RepID=A0A8T4IDS1_9SPHN|nr:DUF1206 domain-containing protein [Stakelama marina]MBR0553168.1 DUF1206 domain-containing protein [Stakelama marina]